jgi:5'-nucleotidase
MNILLTNDDGYQASGINFLKSYFEQKGEKVFIVAPDTEKSGSSHSITLRDSIRLIFQKDNLWVLKGTPADCVMLATLGLVPDKIDLVISGINHGPNIGRDIIYSGTAGAARQGGFLGIPSIALSINAWHGEMHFEVIKDFLDKNFSKMIGHPAGDFFFNINFPNLPLDKIQGVQKTIPCPRHYYEDKLTHFDAPLQGRYYWVDGRSPAYELQDGTDAKAIKNNYISVSLVKIFPESFESDIKF